MSKRMATLLLIAGLLIYPLSCFAVLAVGEGVIDETLNLRYEGFDLTPDGFLTGYVINDSGSVLSAVKLDMYTTNPQETRIYWRKRISLGDMAPRARVRVKEPYVLKGEDPMRLKVMFKVPHSANYRN